MRLRREIENIRKRELEGVGMLKVADINAPHISIRHLETFNEKDQTYSGRVSDDHLVLSYVFNGQIEIQYEDGEETALTRNHGYAFYLPGNSYTLTYKGGSIISWVRIVIELAFIEHLIGKLIERNNWLIERMAKKSRLIDKEGLIITPHIFRCINEILKPPVTGNHLDVYLSGKVLELLSIHLERPKSNLITVGEWSYQDLMHFNDLKDFLDLEYMQSHSLSSIGKRFGMNEFKLKKGFKSLFGTTVFGYINDLRMSRAGQLLKDGHSVKEIAGLLSYSYPQHFSSAFKRHFGLSPREYVRKGKIGLS